MGSPLQKLLRVKEQRPSFFRTNRAPGLTNCWRGRPIGLQILAGIGPGRRLVQVDIRHNRRAVEQGVFVRVVSFEVDSDRQPLHDFDEIARGILRRQQRQRRSGPHREAGDPTLEYVSAPYMSTYRSTGWPMRKSRSCVSLKLASTQISRSERTAIKLCPTCTLLPGLTFRRVTPHQFPRRCHNNEG